MLCYFCCCHHILLCHNTVLLQQLGKYVNYLIAKFDTEIAFTGIFKHWMWCFITLSNPSSIFCMKLYIFFIVPLICPDSYIARKFPKYILLLQWWWWRWWWWGWHWSFVGWAWTDKERESWGKAPKGLFSLHFQLLPF